jgi:hypothetical protein
MLWDVVAMTSNYEPDPARFPLLLREHVGVDPDDADVLLDLAAIGITNGTWRTSPLEDWHGAGRIHDGGMLRANVATTKLVRSILDDHLDDTFADAGKEFIATPDLAALDSDFSDELFADVFEWLSNPDRVLPNGRTLGHSPAKSSTDSSITWTERSVASPPAPSGTASTSPCSAPPFTAGWRARTGGGRPGGPTSWPSSSPDWTTLSIPTGAKPASGTWICQGSLPRLSTGVASARCCSMPQRHCPRRPQSSASRPGSASSPNPSRPGEPPTARPPSAEPAEARSCYQPGPGSTVPLRTSDAGG